MKPTENVIDFATFRRRKQAQQLARIMWDLYARNLGQQAALWAQLAHSTETRHA